MGTEANGATVGEGEMNKHSYWIHVGNIEAIDNVHKLVAGQGESEHCILLLPGGITLSFAGLGAESEANLLGFLDQMHQIRNVLMDDISNRSTTEV